MHVLVLCAVLCALAGCPGTHVVVDNVATPTEGTAISLFLGRDRRNRARPQAWLEVGDDGVTPSGQKHFNADRSRARYRVRFLRVGLPQNGRERACSN